MAVPRRVVACSLAVGVATAIFPALAWGAAMGEIRSAETRTGSFATAGQVDTFTFAGEAGQVVLLMMSAESPSSNEPRLDLRSPSNVLVPSTHFFNTTEIGPQVLPETGSYTVEARLWAGSSGTYSVSLLVFGGAVTSPTDADGGELQSAETVSGVMDLRADTDAWTFRAVAGDGLVAHLSRESGGTAFEPRLRLYDPHGTLEASEFGSSTAIVADWTLLQSGTYTLVTTYRSGTAPGPYSLSLLLLPGPTVSPGDPDGGILGSGGSGPGTLDRHADTDAFAFAGQAGDSVTIAMIGSCGELTLEPWIRLLSPSGTIETSAFGSGSAQIAAHPLAETGAYTAVAGRWSGTPPCSYTLGLTKSPPGTAMSCLAEAIWITGSTVAWNASAGGGVSPQTWRWWFGDGDGSTEPNFPVHTYPGVGSWAWHLLVRDVNGEACMRQGLFTSPGEQLFLDGFESGGLTPWSGHLP